MKHLILFLVVLGLVCGPVWAEGGRNQAAAGKVERGKSGTVKSSAPTVSGKEKSKTGETQRDTTEEKYDYFVDKNGNGVDDHLIQSNSWKGTGREKVASRDHDSAKRAEKPRGDGKPASTEKPAKSTEKRSK